MDVSVLGLGLMGRPIARGLIAAGYTVRGWNRSRLPDDLTRDIPLVALRSQVASAIDVVVHTARLADGSRKITAVSEVLGLQNGEYHLQDLMLYRIKSREAHGRLIGEHGGTGAIPRFMESVRLAGLTLDENMFKAVV